jgi:acetyl-CoA carboxylase carboxyl transferase subunit beta
MLWRKLNLKTRYVLVGKSKVREVVICCMDFIGGSMGAVVGEKISRGINHSIKTKSIHHDFKSGGARMMELIL